MIDINLADIGITLTTDDAGKLRYFLMQSGALFSEACRMVCCSRPDPDCSLCSRSRECDWYTVFGQELSCSPESLRRHQKPSLPFSFSFLPASPDPSILTCRLIVAGRAIYCLDLILKGIAEFVSGFDSRRKPSILKVVSRDYQLAEFPLGSGSRIDHPENLMVLSADQILDLWPWGYGQIGISLHSPLRLLYEGKSVREFSFSLFARSLLRRVSSFAYYYGGGEIDADFSRLAQLAGQQHEIESSFRFDASPGGHKKLSGITGCGRFKGDFIELMPFLVVGSYLNTGKGAAFGMGQYELIPG